MKDSVLRNSKRDDSVDNSMYYSFRGPKLNPQNPHRWLITSCSSSSRGSDASGHQQHPYSHAHTYTHSHAHTHTYSHAHTHTLICTHAHMHTCSHAHMHTPTHTHIPTHSHAHIPTHTYIPTHPHILTCTYPHADTELKIKSLRSKQKKKK